MKILQTKPMPYSNTNTIISWCNKQLGYGGFKSNWFAWEEIEDIKWVVEHQGGALKFTFMDDKALSLFMLRFGEYV